MVYVLMALLGIGAAILTVMRSRARAELLSVSLVAWGIVCIAEWLAHSIFNLYPYRTGLSSDPHYDTAWGIFLGEFVFLPVLCVVLVALVRPWLVVIIGTALVTAMEAVFVPLGLYWHWARETGMKDRRLLPSADANGSLVRLVMHGIGMWLGFWALLPQQWSERWGRIALTIAGMIVITEAFAEAGWLRFFRPFSGVLDAGAIGVITIAVGMITDWVAALAKVPRGPGVVRWEPPE